MSAGIGGPVKVPSAAGTATAEDLAAQQALGKTKLVSPSAAAAAEALATQYGAGSTKLITPANETKLNGLASGGWCDDVAKLFDTYAPGSRDWGYVKPGAFPHGRSIPAGFTDPSRSGAALRLASGSTYWSSDILPQITGSPPTQGVRAQPWGIAFDLATVVPVPGEYCQLGLMNAGASQLLELLIMPSRDATHWMLFTNDGTGTDGVPPGALILGPVVDNARHTIIFAYDTINFRLIFDGTVVLTTSTLAHMPTAACALHSGATLNQYLDFWQIAWRV